MKKIITILTCLSYFLCSAQDTHYWTSQYGPGGYFTPGSVIAYNGDSGVYYYNPALLSRNKKSALSLNTVLYQTQYIKITNGAGTEKDLTSRNNNSIPVMVAGSFTIGRKKTFALGYSLIHTPGINFTSNQRRDENFQVLEDYYSPGTEYFVGQYNIQNKASETRAQVSTGFKINKKLSGGVLLEGNNYNQYYNISYQGRALVNPGIVDFQLSGNEVSYLADYNSYGLRARLGLAYDISNHHFGLTINTPIIHIGGSGTILSDNLVTNLKIAETEPAQSILANTRQEKLDTKWKTPLSIGLGYIYDYKKGQLYLAVEHFNKVDEYDILAPNADEFFIRPDTGSNNIFTYSLLRLKDAKKAVTNFAIANSYQLNDKLIAYLCFRTDFSFIDKSVFADSNGFLPYTAYWDNYHIQLGLNRKTAKRNFKAGIVFTTGSTNLYDQEINMDNPNESNFLIGTPGQTKASHLTLGLVLSYIQNL